MTLREIFLKKRKEKKSKTVYPIPSKQMLVLPLQLCTPRKKQKICFPLYVAQIKVGIVAGGG